MYPWVPWALQTEPPDMSEVPLWRIAWHHHAGPARATSRSIHLQPLTGRGHISKPELQQIYPRCLYAYHVTNRPRGRQAKNVLVEFFVLDLRGPFPSNSTISALNSRMAQIKVESVAYSNFRKRTSYRRSTGQNLAT